MEAHAFSDLTRLVPDELALLMVLGDEDRPIGARIALRALKDQGIRTSEASVSRILSRLDALGLTERLGRKGRLLTDAGHQAYRLRRLQARRSESFDRALELRTITELQDWLRARRVIETEAASLAAQRRTDRGLDELNEAVDSHERAAVEGNLGFRTVGMQFHVIIARAAESPVFEALIESLTSSRVESVEHALDLITASRGTLGDSAADHRQILDAIRIGDPQSARDLMGKHLSRLEHEVEQFADGEDGTVLLTTLSAMGSLETVPTRV